MDEEDHILIILFFCIIVILIGLSCTWRYLSSCRRTSERQGTLNQAPPRRISLRLPNGPNHLRRSFGNKMRYVAGGEFLDPAPRYSIVVPNQASETSKSRPLILDLPETPPPTYAEIAPLTYPTVSLLPGSTTS